MVEIDGGAWTAAGGSLLLVCAFLQLQLAAPAWPLTLADWPLTWGPPARLHFACLAG